MNKIVTSLLSIFLLASCLGEHDSKAQKAHIAKEQPKQLLYNTDTINVNLSLSNIHWKGTKMKGTGKHEGEVALKSAYFLIESGHLKGGGFITDMASIVVTDIPVQDSIPIRNITDHLKSNDFFDVEKHPMSSFEITEVNKSNSDSLKISGNLTIKNVTNNIAFWATFSDGIFTTKFKFDRFRWNIAYQGVTNKTLVDEDIELRIKLKSE